MAHSTDVFLKQANKSLASCFPAFNTTLQSITPQHTQSNSEGECESLETLVCTIFDFMKFSFLLKYNTQLFTDFDKRPFLVSAVEILVHFMQITAEQVIIMNQFNSS